MISAAYETPAPFEDCGRREARTNMFVLATLVSGTASNRVKIRNMSASGALIEGPLLPRAGATFSLCRADTTLTGRVAWSAGNRAGLSFDVRAIVADWLPSTNAGQRATDQAVQLAKAEKAAGILPTSNAPLQPSAILAKDLTTMAAMLDQLADELAGDPQVVAKFMTKLQILDIAGQALRTFARQANT